MSKILFGMLVFIVSFLVGVFLYQTGNKNRREELGLWMMIVSFVGIAVGAIMLVNG